MIVIIFVYKSLNEVNNDFFLVKGWNKNGKLVICIYMV